MLVASLNKIQITQKNKQRYILFGTICRCCQKSKAFWAWENGVKVHDNQMNVDISKISKHVILDYVASKR